jgi:hypothetical protein
MVVPSSRRQVLVGLVTKDLEVPKAALVDRLRSKNIVTREVTLQDLAGGDLNRISAQFGLFVQAVSSGPPLFPGQGGHIVMQSDQLDSSALKILWYPTEGPDPTTDSVPPGARAMSVDQLVAHVAAEFDEQADNGPRIMVESTGTRHEFWLALERIVRKEWPGSPKPRCIPFTPNDPPRNPFRQCRGVVLIYVAGEVDMESHFAKADSIEKLLCNFGNSPERFVANLEPPVAEQGDLRWRTVRFRVDRGSSAEPTDRDKFRELVHSIAGLTA